MKASLSLPLMCEYLKSSEEDSWRWYTCVSEIKISQNYLNLPRIIAYGNTHRSHVVSGRLRRHLTLSINQKLGWPSEHEPPGRVCTIMHDYSTARLYGFDPQASLSEKKDTNG